MNIITSIWIKQQIARINNVYGGFILWDLSGV